MNNKPKLRFPEFTDAWEQRKLSEIATMHARIGWQNLRTSEFLDQGDYMLITGTDFDDGRINYSTCHYVEKERYDQDPHIQIHNGSILITKDGTLGKVAYVQGLEMPATLNAGVFNVEIKDENYVDGKYLFQYLKAPFLMDYVGQKATGGTIKHLNQNILVDFPVVLPEKSEQEKIGQYLEGIDNLITLHQRKLDNIKEYKSGMLQKMFPKEGEDIPEVRFPGFHDAWEQRKLSDCCGQLSATLNPQDTPDDVFAEYSMPAFDNGEVPDIVAGKTMNSVRKILDRPCLLINKLNVRKKRIWNVEMPEKNAVSSAEFVPVYSDDINLCFLKYIVLSDSFTAYLEDCSSGSSNSQKRVTPDIIMSAAFMFPSKGEQDRIGEYFEQIDNLITLHQRKLDEIKEYKQGLLQKMFV